MRSITLTAGRCLALALALAAGWAAAATAIEPAGAPPPVHGLVAQLDGDFSGLPAQDDPRFGHALAQHGDVLAVGAPGTLTNGPGGIGRGGAVFVYRWQASGWALLQRLVFASDEDGDCGHALDLSAQFLAIGCPTHRTPTQVAPGRALVLRRQANGSYQQPFEFVPTGGIARCGFSVAVVDSAPGTDSPLPMFAVGCPEAFASANGGALGAFSGKVEVFRWLLDWAPAASVQDYPSIIDGGFRFGHSIDLHRSGAAADPDLLLVVGIPGLEGTGAVRIHAMGATFADWVEERTFTGSPLSRFGHAVHMRGNRLVIGAPEHQVINPALGGLGLVPGGRISIASRSCPVQGNCGWNQQQQLVNIFAQAIPFPVAVAQNRLGQSVHALSASRLVAGEPLHPVTSQVGRARRYSLDGADWQLVASEPFYAAVTAPDSSEFGYAVAGDETWLAIGAPGYPQAHDGRVFVYRYDFDDTLFTNDFECAGQFPGCI